jgi:hypothetical protein
LNLGDLDFFHREARPLSEAHAWYSSMQRTLRNLKLDLDGLCCGCVGSGEKIDQTWQATPADFTVNTAIFSALHHLRATHLCVMLGSIGHFSLV